MLLLLLFFLFISYFLYSILSNLAFSNFCIRGDSTMAVHVTVSMVVSAILILNYYIRVGETRNCSKATRMNLLLTMRTQHHILNKLY